MEQPVHTMNSLFDQLGLDSSDSAIEDFIDSHRPLASEVELHEADFWSPAQAGFLQQQIDRDADWAEIVDHLDALLRYPHD